MLHQQEQSDRNKQFQRDLSTMIKGDSDYSANSTLERLCEMVAGIVHAWERLTVENNCMSGHTTSGSSSNSGRTKTAKPREDSSITTVGTK